MKITFSRHFLFLLLTSLGLMMLVSCKSDADQDTLFEKISPSSSNIVFSNTLSPTNAFNIYTYANFYSGGGVGLGDFNKDGLLDVYLSANQKSNKLYLNQGNFTFKDITEEAGVSGKRAWSTGVSIADVNGDGWPDIYVCNAGEIRGDDRKNELFINNGDLTFTERAKEFGLADSGLSIHASFFDYDRDGDLDMYLLNYTSRSIGSFDLRNNQRNDINFKGGDRLYRNDLIQQDASSEKTALSENKTPRFTDVTQEAGIYSSEIGFGLGVSVADINRDGWQDIFISNDFFERDYLYLNNQDGTFREVIEQQMNSISTTSMGGDIADLNHDGLPEIFVTDMLPKNEKRLKTITTFADWEQYQFELENDYYHQMTRNVLQLNNGNSTFSEIGRYAGVEATAWSWGALINDFNLDGHRDIFVSNGIFKDMTDQDHLLHVSQQEVINSVVQNNRVNYEKLIDMIPSNPLPNYVFEHNGGLRFTNRAQEWGLGEPGFSNGSAYGDLDNDGDMDLVVNNVNMEAFIYRNQVREKYPDRQWLQLELKGAAPNTLGTGSQAVLIANGKRWHAEQMPIRGYQSTVDPRLHFGLNKVNQIDTLWVRWPDGRLSRKLNVETNQLITLNQEHAHHDTSWTELWRQQSKLSNSEKAPLLEDITDSFEIDWQHLENEYVDFMRQPLLFHTRSTEGPPLCVGDLNGDDQQDFYVGGAKGQAGILFIQTASGGFNPTIQDAFESDSNSEDTDCAIFDANGNRALDLYVASGGDEFRADDTALADRLYINNGNGQFNKADGVLTSLGSNFHTPTGEVAPADYDNDGDIDLFVGTRMQPGAYGVSGDSYLLENNGQGQLKNVTEQHIPALSGIGHITDAAWGDMDGDSDLDLLIAGEWIPITLFRNENSKFREMTNEAGLDSTQGWWNTLELADLDGDGDLDWVAGNHGLNSRFRASQKQPVELWTNDFNHDGNFEHILTTFNGGRAYPVAQRHDLIDQLPMLASKAPSYHSYAEKTVQDLFTEQELQESIHLQATMLSSSVGWNDGNGHFRIEKLPMEAQLSPVYSILAQDYNNDGRSELLLGGNLHRVKPQAGPYDAGYGILLQQDSTGQYQTMLPQESGFMVEGEIRAIRPLEYKGQTFIIVARNDKQLKVFKVNER